jgi:hypothetical protein
MIVGREARRGLALAALVALLVPPLLSQAYVLAGARAARPAQVRPVSRRRTSGAA